MDSQKGFMLPLPEGRARSGSRSEIHDRAGGCSVGTEQRKIVSYGWQDEQDVI